MTTRNEGALPLAAKHILEANGTCQLIVDIAATVIATIVKRIRGAMAAAATTTPATATTAAAAAPRVLLPRIISILIVGQALGPATTVVTSSAPPLGRHPQVHPQRRGAVLPGATDRAGAAKSASPRAARPALLIPVRTVGGTRIRRAATAIRTAAAGAARGRGGPFPPPAAAPAAKVVYGAAPPLAALDRLRRPHVDVHDAEAAWPQRATRRLPHAPRATAASPCAAASCCFGCPGRLGRRRRRAQRALALHA